MHARPNIACPMASRTEIEVAAEMSANPQCIEALVRREIRELEGYAVPSAGRMIKLDAMENPHRLPADLRRQWLARLSEVAVNRYPDPDCAALKRRLRATFDIPAERDVVLGNGSDELIQMIALLIGGRDRVMLAPTPTFSMYRLISITTGSEFVGVPLAANFEVDGAALLDAIRRHRPACVFLAYPNNPSGNCFDESVIEQVLEQAPGVVVLDEAYFSFCGRSFLSRLNRYPDMMVLRTLSKSGMAGLRLGMLIAHPHWAAQLEKVRLPYNINSLTQCSAEFYLAHHETLQQQAADIVARREQMFARLAERRGVRPYPSAANFILFSLERDADLVHDSLQNLGVLVRNLHRAATPLENCLRVTIGTETENKRFLEALDSSLS